MFFTTQTVTTMTTAMSTTTPAAITPYTQTGSPQSEPKKAQAMITHSKHLIACLPSTEQTRISMTPI